MCYLGVDIGGTTIKVGLVDEAGTIIYKDAFDTQKNADYRTFSKDIAEFCIKLIEKIGITLDDVVSVGMGCPGTIDSKAGLVTYANNIDLKNAPIALEVQKYLSKPVYIDNDANCAALGEYYALGNDDVKDFVLITLGTGVGSGIIIDGKVYSGCNGAGGELGHTVIDMNGEICSCGRRGCWEAYASATALIRDAKKKAEEKPESSLAKRIAQNGGKADGKLIWELSNSGDSAAKEVTDAYAFYVAEGIINTVNVFRPKLIAIGGGISKAGDALLKPVSELVRKYHYGAGYIEAPEITVAKLGNDAGIIGAAFLGK